jgi:hypothetical protein
MSLNYVKIRIGLPVRQIFSSDLYVVYFYTFVPTLYVSTAQVVLDLVSG